MKKVVDSMEIYALQNDPIVGLGIIDHWAAMNNEKIHIVSVDLNEPFPDLDAIDLLIVLGGRMGAYEEDQYPWLVKEKEFIRMAVQRSKHILGICLGCQLIADALGGRAYKNTNPELGWHSIQFIQDESTSHPLLKKLPLISNFFEFHYDTFSLPESACLVFQNDCSLQGFTVGENLLAVQFHPEFDEEAIRFLQENEYPKDAEGPYIQPLSQIVQAENLADSKKTMFQILENFKRHLNKDQPAEVFFSHN